MRVSGDSCVCESFERREAQRCYRLPVPVYRHHRYRYRHRYRHRYRSTGRLLYSTVSLLILDGELSVLCYMVLSCSWYCTWYCAWYQCYNNKYCCAVWSLFIPR